MLFRTSIHQPRGTIVLWVIVVAVWRYDLAGAIT